MVSWCQLRSTSVKLSSTALPELEGRVSTPGYDRSALQPSVVHIGVGGFHRAHLATYIHELCQAGNTDWSITGAGVLATDSTMAEILADQDYLYTLITRGAAETSVDIIGSITGFVLGSRRPSSLSSTSSPHPRPRSCRLPLPRVATQSTISPASTMRTLPLPGQEPPSPSSPLVSRLADSAMASR